MGLTFCGEPSEWLVCFSMQRYCALLCSVYGSRRYSVTLRDGQVLPSCSYLLPPASFFDDGD